MNRRLCRERSPFELQSWSTACPGRRCQIPPHLQRAEMAQSHVSGVCFWTLWDILYLFVNNERWNKPPCLAYISPRSSSPHEGSSGYIPANPKIWQSGPKNWAWPSSVPIDKQKQTKNLYLFPPKSQYDDLKYIFLIKKALSSYQKMLLYAKKHF